MAALWTILICVVALIILACVYWMVLRHFLTSPLRVAETHWIRTPDLWHVRLCRYRRKAGGEPVLLLHGTLANHLTFAVPQGRSLIDTLTAQGYDCWCLDLRGTRSSVPPYGVSRRHATLDAMLEHDLPAVVQFIRQTSGFNQIHWVGHSLGGMLLYAYEIAYGCEHLASGTTLGAPPGFIDIHQNLPRSSGILIQAFARLGDHILRAFAPVVPIIRPNFTMVPVNWQNMNRAVGSAAFFNFTDCVPLPVAAELAFWMSSGHWRMLDDEIDVVADLDTLETPLFTLFGQHDVLVPLSTATRFFNALPGRKKQMAILSVENGYSADYNHLDLLFAANAVDEVYEPIVEWIQAHPVEGWYTVDAEEQSATERPDEMPPPEAEPARKSPVAAKKQAAKKKSAVPKKKATVKKKAAAKKKPATRKKATPKTKSATKKPVAEKKATVRKKSASKKKSAPQESATE